MPLGDDLAWLGRDGGYSDEMMHTALDINMPNYASAIVSTEEIAAAIAAP